MIRIMPNLMHSHIQVDEGIVLFRYHAHGV